MNNILFLMLTISSTNAFAKEISVKVDAPTELVKQHMASAQLLWKVEGSDNAYWVDFTRQEALDGVEKIIQVDENQNVSYCSVTWGLSATGAGEPVPPKQIEWMVPSDFQNITRTSCSLNSSSSSFSIKAPFYFQTMTVQLDPNVFNTKNAFLLMGKLTSNDIIVPPDQKSFAFTATRQSVNEVHRVNVLSKDPVNTINVNLEWRLIGGGTRTETFESNSSAILID